jgi:hypothetical protein
MLMLGGEGRANYPVALNTQNTTASTAPPELVTIYLQRALYSILEPEPS